MAEPASRLRAALLACVLAVGACEQQRDFEFSVRQINTMTPSSLPAFFDCLREGRVVVVSAHRGGPGPRRAENAIATFEQAVTQAPVLLEVDIARTRDGALVLMHDDTVDRTTNGEGTIAALTLAEFQTLRLRDEDGEVLEESPPSLRQALDWADGRAILELDMKRGVSYLDVAREVEDAGAMGRVVFITYSVDGASRLARVAPRAMIYTTITSARDLDTLERRGVDLSRIVAWLGDEELDRDLLEALNARGVEARWGLFGRNADFTAAAEAGVQGIAVNDPEGAVRAIDAADGTEGYAALQCATGQSPTGRYDRWINED